MIARLLLQNAVWTAGMALLLLAPAGTLRWPQAWVFLATIAALGIGCGLYLAKTDPALLRERMRPPVQDDQPAADKAFVAAFGFAALMWFLLMGLERRAGRAGMPLPIEATGWGLILLSTLVIMAALRANSFAVPVIRLQQDRQQQVVDHGPYALVRHPMYSGVALFFLGMPLLLGSRWGLAMVPLLIALFAIRTVIEERALRQGLPGYADYAARVRYRLAPGLW
uniref:Isoprenylcysteine carboxyl methyltransferase n=1 Tax=Rhodopseudomonas palustris (strain BisA53) TaxID=316055 RepID=Q07RC1_RHOP5